MNIKHLNIIYVCCLKVPRAVLFHATAIHCHYGIDIEDASFLVLERELLICPQFIIIPFDRVLYLL